ncbi:glycosyl transferase group 1 [Leadbetterella byssophila DSM 17132]|uniref:Glycosyl transferase group 1 n=1 Tax=Leadbetterella byssophila (strain DSM 17132 / JCM 16389 / KACC 11308 / NBRC 106382 / 4M15) TaxID=649349 RepID=E4RXB8_LEAB4|nr:glycosyltransferase family 4 protein [Leadbetterella byssophila]ADQ16263.1 glycosyl transferase group 1 [Leadbetterella byssophila DSM 17132]
MEILFVSHKYPPSTGGMEKQSFELINGMKRYAKVHMLVYEGQESLLSFFIHLQKRITQIIKENPGIQMVHFNDGLIGTFCSFHKSYAHIARSVTLHGLDVTFPSSFYRIRLLTRMNRYDKIIAVSDATAKEAIKSGLDPEKVVVVANGVDTKENAYSAEELPIIDPRPFLLMLGRPVERKGFSWFINHVLPLVRKKYQLIIVGPYKEVPNLLERILHILPKKLRTRIMLFLGFPSDSVNLRKLLPGNPDVKHLGHLPYTTIVQLFRRSAAFIMPNIHQEGDMEGFGLVCLEASVNGALVLASQVDGIPSAIHSYKNGILLPADDPNAWAKTLMDLEKYQNKKEAFTLYTKENFSWDRMVKAYLKVFQNDHVL